MRRDDYRATLILFSSGRFVAVARSQQLAVIALEGVAKEISEQLSINPSIEEPKIVNMVATADLCRKIDLNAVSKEARCTYEPKKFPGMICHLADSVVLLVFHSGKVSCVGAKSESQISEAFEWLKQKIQ